MAREKIFVETVTFGAGHSLIIGHKPEKVTFEQIYNKMEHNKEIEQFGLFDRSTPNYTTYYPDVTPEDLAPQDAEYIEPVFRILSNVTVHERWNPIYFPSDVLKASMYKLIGQTINIDHEMAVGNAIGAIKSVEWQNAYTAIGVKVPAGINGVLKIDGKANPRIARGIMMEPPSIHSNSVTVNFGWKKSHPTYDDEEFFNKIGTYDAKGKLVQKIATEIKAYHETSLVGHGADPFAQKVDSKGKIVNPIYAGSRYNLSDQTIDNKNINAHYVYVDLKSLKDYNPEQETISSITYTNTENMEEFLRFLETFHKLEAESLTKDNYQEKLKEIEAAHATALAAATKESDPLVICELEGEDAIKGEIESLRTKLSAVPDDITQQMALAETGKVVIEDLRKDTKRLYGLTVEEGKTDAAILAVIEGSDYPTLKALHKQYETTAEEAFSHTCDDCGSKNVTRATAKPAQENDPPEEKSDSDVKESFTGVNKVKIPDSLKLEVK